MLKLQPYVVHTMDWLLSGAPEFAHKGKEGPGEETKETAAPRRKIHKELSRCGVQS